MALSFSDTDQRAVQYEQRALDAEEVGDFVTANRLWAAAASLRAKAGRP